MSHRKNSRLLTKKIIAKALNLSADWVEGTKTFDSDQIFNIAVLAAMEKTSIEDICDDVREDYFEELQEVGRANMSKSKPPSPDTVLQNFRDSVEKMTAKDLGKSIAKILQRLIRQLPEFRGNRIPRVELAIDLHDEEYYGKLLFDISGNRLVFHTNKHGKSKNALRYATITIVSVDNSIKFPLTLGFGVNHVGQARKEVVDQLLGQLKIPMKIDRLIMDGGFASAGILEYLDKKNIKWITRGNYSSKTKYLGEPDGEWFPYELAGKYTVAAYLISMNTPGGGTETALLLCSRFWTPSSKTLKKIYRKRFRIENTYRHARVTKIRTSTRNTHLRWIFWAISHFLELIWEIICILGTKQGIRKYQLRQKRIVRILRELLKSYIFVEKMG